MAPSSSSTPLTVNVALGTVKKAATWLAQILIGSKSGWSQQGPDGMSLQIFISRLERIQNVTAVDHLGQLVVQCACFPVFRTAVWPYGICTDIPIFLIDLSASHCGLRRAEWGLMESIPRAAQNRACFCIWRDSVYGQASTLKLLDSIPKFLYTLDLIWLHLLLDRHWHLSRPPKTEKVCGLWICESLFVQFYTSKMAELQRRYHIYMYIYLCVCIYYI